MFDEDFLLKFFTIVGLLLLALSIWFSFSTDNEKSKAEHQRYHDTEYDYYYDDPYDREEHYEYCPRGE